MAFYTPVFAKQRHMIGGVNQDIKYHHNFTKFETLSIEKLSPSSGKAGDQIRIFGRGFGLFADQVVVRFNGAVAQVNLSGEYEISVTVPKGASTGNITIEVNGAKATSPQEFVMFGGLDPSAQFDSQLRLYPNPVTSSLLRIEAKDNASSEIKLTLYNLHGQEIRQNKQSFENEETILNLTGIDTGEYILILTIGNKTTSRRIIKR
jgi:hypothetical protein